MFRKHTVMLLLAVAAAARAGAPAEIDVQGMYKGKGEGDRLLTARVIALGKNEYLFLGEQTQADGKVARVEFGGKLAGEKVTFAGKVGNVEWKGAYADGKIAGQMGDIGEFALARLAPKSPTLGRKAPEGSTLVLGDGTVDNMSRNGGNPWFVGPMSQDGWAVWEVPVRTIVAENPPAWPDAKTPVPEGWTLGTQRRKVDEVRGIGEDGSIQIPRHGMNSKQQFDGSFDAHVEFLVPFRPDQRGQGRGNSGCYLPCGQEIQVLDSFGMKTYKGGGCGGLYNWKNPITFDPVHEYNLSCYPPMTWQTYDIEYRVEKKDGKFVGKPRLTVMHNGIKIHDKQELRGHRKGGFSFQDHGNPVRYRNIWVLPVVEKETKTF
ncbi:DUF1080 domain-containing protein [bacterium]|nr:DUF1080 domain-containing protein [bacterium]